MNLLYRICYSNFRTDFFSNFVSSFKQIPYLRTRATFWRATFKYAFTNITKESKKLFQNRVQDTSLKILLGFIMQSFIYCPFLVVLGVFRSNRYWHDGIMFMLGWIERQFHTPKEWNLLVQSQQVNIIIVGVSSQIIAIESRLIATEWQIHITIARLC